MGQGLYEAVCHVGELLRNFSQDIHGWNVVLHSANQADFVEPSVSVLLSMRNNSGIVLTDSAYELLSGTFECRREDSLWILTEQGIHLSVISEGIGAILNRDAIREEILDAIEPGLNGRVTESYGIRVHGPRYAGKRHNVHTALEKISGLQKFSWCCLHASARDKSQLQPMLNSIDRNFLADVEGFLTPLERRVWKYRDTFPDFICSDQKIQDFLCAYELYLRAYARNCVVNGLPPIIVIEDISDFAGKTVEVLNTLLKRLSLSEGVFPLIIEDMDSSTSHTLQFEFETKRDVSVLSIEKDELRDTLGSLIHAHWIEEVIEVSGGDPYFAYFMLPALDYGAEIAALSGGTRTALTYVLSHTDYDTREYIYLRVLLDEVASPEVFHAFLTSRGYTNLTRYEDICVSIGIVDRKGRIYKAEVLLEILEQQEYEDKNSLRNDAFRYLHRAWHSRSIGNKVLFLTLLYEYNERSYAQDVFIDVIESSLDSGQLIETELLLADAEKSATENQSDYSTMYSLRLSLCRMRLGILRADRELAGTALESIQRYPYGHDLPEVLCALSEFQYADGDLESSLSYAKSAVMQSVDGRENHVLCISNMHIGLVMLRRGRTEEAKEYFVMASDIADRKSRPFDYVRAKTLEAISFSLYGDQSRALESCATATNTARQITRRNWEVFTIFLNGRIHFEIGEYGDAISCFLDGMSMCRLYSLTTVFRICRNWMIRARIYAGDELTNDEINSFELTQESLYFLSEYYYFNGNFAAACRLLDEAIRLKSDEHIGSIQGSEVVRWSSGFAFIEDLAYEQPKHLGDGESVLTKLIHGFAALATFRRDGSTESTTILDDLIHEKRRSLQDPVAQLLFIYRSCVTIEEPQSQSVSRMTILSKSLQNIQTRASRNQASTHRLAYLRKNRWNKMILLEANKNHLL